MYMRPSEEITMRLLIAAFPSVSTTMVEKSNGKSMWKIYISPRLECPEGATFYFPIHPKE